MSTLINDGNVAQGSRDLVIGGVTFPTDDFSWDTDSKEILKTDKNDVPTGRMVIKQGTSGTATLQLPTPATAVPAWGATFSTTEGTCYISRVGRREAKGAFTVVPVSFFLAITGSVVVT